MNIKLEPSKRYTPVEIDEVIIDLLEEIKLYLPQNKRRFPPADFYWIIIGLLRYVNKMMDGEFKLRSIKKNNWEVVYIDEKMAKQRAKNEAKKQMEKAAEYIKETTDIRPKWSSQEK